MSFLYQSPTSVTACRELNVIYKVNKDFTREEFIQNFGKDNLSKSCFRRQTHRWLYGDRPISKGTETGIMEDWEIYGEVEKTIDYSFQPQVLPQHV